MTGPQTGASGKPRVGVSACLLGQEVRYDGGHKREGVLLERLGPLVEWVPLCPEVELGLGVPRPALHIEEREGGERRLVMPESGRDWTAPMRRYARERCEALAALGLSGYVFKSGSPSCALRSVKVRRTEGRPRRAGRGLFAEALVERFPHLPVEDERRLRDARRLEDFVAHLLAYGRWQELEREGLSPDALARFHRQHEPELMARSRAGTRRLARLIRSAEGRPPADEVAARYLEGFTATMRHMPSRQLK